MARTKPLPVALPTRARGDAARAELLRRMRHGNARALGRFFGGLARASLAASVIAAAGCSETTVVGRGDMGSLDLSIDGGGIDAGRDMGAAPWMPICEGREVWRPAAGITPASPKDYIAIADGGFWSPEAWIWDEVGVACESATNPDACLENLRQLLSDNPVRHFQATDADGARAYVSDASVLELFGPIDTAEEAVLLAWHAGYTVARCDDVTNYAVRPSEGGWELRVTDDIGCYGEPTDVYRYTFTVRPNGTMRETAQEVARRDEGGCAIGRRPEGLLPHAPPALSATLGRELAEMAHLEASAVVAFEILADELEALGAPVALVREAKRAAMDEVRHAEEVQAHALRFGAEPAPVTHERRPLRDLRALAMDNATEGCVRETFGALMGHRQSLAAEDPALARTLKGIAADETRHAALSWQIHAWALGQLDDATIARIEEAMGEAVDGLRAHAAAPASDPVAKALGLPTPAEALALVDALETTLWRS
ncbi:MAG: ferritin-like domain-containing protein [Myxococcota bacterium]